MARTDYGAILSTKIADTSQAIRDVNKTVGMIAPADWGTLIRAMKSGADYQNALDQMIEETATGSIASFTDGANNIPAKEVICHINPTETGTGTKSPSNPYVIGGFTECNITRAGKNYVTDFYQVNNNTIEIFHSGEVLPAGNYKLLFFRNMRRILVRNIDTATNIIDLSNKTEVNINLSIATNIRITVYEVSGITPSEPMILCESDTIKDYNVPFGQTVYGGTLNVTTGVLTITGKVHTINGTENFRVASQNYIKSDACDAFVTVADIDTSEVTSISKICNRFDYSAVNGIWAKVGYPNMWQFNGNQIHLNIANDLIGVTDYTQETMSSVSAKIKAWVTNNNVNVFIPIATYTVQLTPQEIKTLLGANNIYHDCNGDTDVTYRANGELYVEQHTT